MRRHRRGWGDGGGGGGRVLGVLQSPMCHQNHDQNLISMSMMDSDAVKASVLKPTYGGGGIHLFGS